MEAGLHFEIQRLGAAADDVQLARIFDIHHGVGEYHLYGDSSFEGIEEYARSTLELADRMGARRAQAFAWCLLGESHLLHGHWDEAAVCRGDAAAAEEYLRKGMTIATVSPMAHHLWGRLYAALGDLPKAEEHARAAEQVAGFWESAAWKAMAETTHASLALARDDPSQALSRFLAAADLYERAGQPFWAARCLLQAGLARGGEVADSRNLLERALATFHRLGAARAEESARRALARLAG